jgi:hypothetical protein
LSFYGAVVVKQCALENGGPRLARTGDGEVTASHITNKFLAAARRFGTRVVWVRADLPKVGLVLSVAAAVAVAVAKVWSRRDGVVVGIGYVLRPIQNRVTVLVVLAGRTAHAHHHGTRMRRYVAVAVPAMNTAVAVLETTAILAVEIPTEPTTSDDAVVFVTPTVMAHDDVLSDAVTVTSDK